MSWRLPWYFHDHPHLMRLSSYIERLKCSYIGFGRFIEIYRKKALHESVIWKQHSGQKADDIAQIRREGGVNLKAWQYSGQKLIDRSLQKFISKKKSTSRWEVHYHEIHQPLVGLVEGSISCLVCFKLCLWRADLGGGLWEVKVSTRSIMVFGPRANNVRILWTLKWGD